MSQREVGELATARAACIETMKEAGLVGDESHKWNAADCIETLREAGLVGAESHKWNAKDCEWDFEHEELPYFVVHDDHKRAVIAALLGMRAEATHLPVQEAVAAWAANRKATQQLRDSEVFRYPLETMFSEIRQAGNTVYTDRAITEAIKYFNAATMATNRMKLGVSRRLSAAPHSIDVSRGTPRRLENMINQRIGLVTPKRLMDVARDTERYKTRYVNAIDYHDLWSPANVHLLNEVALVVLRYPGESIENMADKVVVICTLLHKDPLLDKNLVIHSVNKYFMNWKYAPSINMEDVVSRIMLRIREMMEWEVAKLATARAGVQTAAD